MRRNEFIRRRRHRPPGPRYPAARAGGCSPGTTPANRRRLGAGNDDGEPDFLPRGASREAFSASHKEFRCTPLLLMSNDLQEPSAALPGRPAPGDRSTIAARPRRSPRLAVRRPQPANRRRRAASSRTMPPSNRGLPGRPMLAGVGHQRVPGEQAQVGRHRPQVQGMMMDDGHGRGRTRRTSRGLRPAAQIDVFVVEEEIRIEPAKVVPAGPAHHQAAARDPIDLGPRVGRWVGVLAPMPGKQQPGERPEQAGKSSRG